MKRRGKVPVVDLHMHVEHFEARAVIGMKSEGAHYTLLPVLHKPLDFTCQR